MQLKDFARKVLFFSLPLAVLLPLCFGCLYSAGYYPVITNSVSLDAKLLDYRSHRFQKIDVLSIGSSMNLNNLNSSEMKVPEGLSYYNFGAWGLQISDTLYLVKYLTEVHHPKCVVMSSSVTDFMRDGGIAIPSHRELDLVQDYLPYFYGKASLYSVLTRHKEFTKYRSDRDDYTSLDFDRNGGVALDVAAGKMSAKRWNEKLSFPSGSTALQYQKLEELATYLQQKKIPFLYVQAPIRRDVASASATELAAHYEKCRAIVTGAGGRYLFLHDVSLYPDGMFVDPYHLRSSGSRIYSRKVSEEVGRMLQRM